MRWLVLFAIASFSSFASLCKILHQSGTLGRFLFTNKARLSSFEEKFDFEQGGQLRSPETEASVFLHLVTKRVEVVKHAEKSIRGLDYKVFGLVFKETRGKVFRKKIHELLLVQIHCLVLPWQNTPQGRKEIGGQVECKIGPSARRAASKQRTVRIARGATIPLIDVWMNAPLLSQTANERRMLQLAMNNGLGGEPAADHEKRDTLS